MLVTEVRFIEKIGFDVTKVQPNMARSTRHTQFDYNRAVPSLAIEDWNIL